MVGMVVWMERRLCGLLLLFAAVWIALLADGYDAAIVTDVFPSLPGPTLSLRSCKPPNGNPGFLLVSPKIKLFMVVPSLEMVAVSDGKGGS